jgi:hypothetical protein
MAAQLVLLPVEPHVFSLETVAKQADLLRAAKNPPAFYVINKAPTQGSDAESAIAYSSRASPFAAQSCTCGQPTACRQPRAKRR